MVSDQQGGASSDVEGRMALAREWDELVEQVRNLEGFEDFMQPAAVETLQSAAADGPVAIINISRWRCDALLVQAAGTKPVKLPNLDSGIIIKRASEYLQILQDVDRATFELHIASKDHIDSDRSAESAQRLMEVYERWQYATRKRDEVLTSLLEWLWDEIANPILSELGFVETPQGSRWPRLWWCPTGLLTLLPLHAAGYHNEPTDRSRTVLDRVVSSYTPSLRALIEARRPVGPSDDNERMLVVAVPNAAGMAPLESAPAERDLVTACFPGRYTLLEDAEATVDTVLDGLSRHRWAHFICHGGQNLLEPSMGGLMLHDGILRTDEIRGRHHDGELAFLSACKTAVGGIMPSGVDEAITLSAALHYTGYRQVIATLWSVYDDTAVDVAAMVYDQLMLTGTFEPSRSAEALHAAVRHLRDVEQLPLAFWTPFTHTGS